MLKGKKIFDLCERAKIGLNFLNNNVDKKRGCLPYFVTLFKNDPAEVRHDWPDFGDLTGRYVESFIMARKILNTPQPGEVELALRKLLISYFSENDGLSYRPKFEEPYYSSISKKMYNEHVAEGFDQARVLWGLLAWYEETGDDSIFKRINELVEGLNTAMIKKGDWGYYDRSGWQPGFVIDKNAEPMPSQFYFCGTQIHPLIECCRRLNIDLAGELAQRLTNYIVYHSNYFLEDGKWHCDKSPIWDASIDGHSHSRFATIAGIAAVGIAAGKTELIEKAKKCYDWFIEDHCGKTGWTLEFFGRYGDENEGCETCTTMDQINCTLAFAEAGFTEYYEEAEKIARNQLLENQFTDTSIVRNTIEKEDTNLSCFHNVADMVRGGFAGWAAANDFIGNCDHHYCLMNCCGPAGIRAIYDIWNNIYTLKENKFYINILMDKADENIKITNEQPENGKIEITPAINCDLYINSRTWLDPQKIEVSINNQKQTVATEENYIVIKNVPAASQVTIEHPLEAITEPMHVNGRDYKVTWKADTVIDIDPPGKIMPMYKGRQ